MKKIVLVFTAAIFGISVNAQQKLAEKYIAKEDVPHNLIPLRHDGLRATIISDWYNYGSTMYGMGGSVSYYRNFLFPDSTVQVEFSSGMGYVWKHSMGQVFDPTSYNFAAGGQFSLTPGMAYTVDTIAIPYRYWRPQNMAPDTLKVQVYVNSDITFQPSPGWSSGASYATVDYDYTTRLGSNDTLTFTYLLTNADIMTSSQGILYFPCGFNVPGGGNKVAATVTYLPGNPYNVNDTIDTYMATTPVNQINAFVFYDYADNDMMVEPMYYNNELSATTEVRYNTSSLGWNGNYIPGTAWLSAIYHGDIYFKITFDADATGQAELSENTTLSMFPNPVADLIQLSSDKPITKAVVYDLGGKAIITLNESNIKSINVAAVEPGSYLVKCQDASGHTANRKFVKQ